MKKIQILGGGCAKCKLLTKEVKKTVKNLGIDATIEKVTDYENIMKFGVMTTPALVVDGEVKFSGTIKKSKDLEQFLI